MTHSLPSIPHKLECSADCCCSYSHTKRQLKLELYFTEVYTWILNDEPQKYNLLYFTKQFSWPISVHTWLYITSVMEQGKVSLNCALGETKQPTNFRSAGSLHEVQPYNLPPQVYGVGIWHVQLEQ